MKGQCLCGAVKITTDDNNEVGLCHCSMCRAWSGGPMFAVHGGTDVGFTGTAPSRYRSSDWAERGFCPTCGTHLFYYLIPNQEYIFTAGLFPDQKFHLTSQIFIDEKPAFYEFKNETKNMTGQQVFEQFSSNT